MVVLVDGEHHPPVLQAAIDELCAAGARVVGAADLGGEEKRGTATSGLSVEVVRAEGPIGSLVAALDRFAPNAVVDLSDAPVVDGPTRALLAAHALVRGVEYRGADFVFYPPPRPRMAAKPSIAVIGTAKRAGKTAVAAAAARTLTSAGRRPVLVTMGRGGPPEPEVIDPATTSLDPSALLARAAAGRHAASDHLEDAVTSGVVTIGTRRAGGGLAGTPAASTFPAGVELANARPEELVVLEGSGTAIPPVHADATICVVPGAADAALALDHLGALRVLLADLVVVTVVPVPPPSGVAALPDPADLIDRVRSIAPRVPVLSSLLRPWPLEPVEGRSVFFATTAPETVAAWQASELASRHGARISGWTGDLARRDRLERALASAEAEVLVTELKAGAVEVAARAALDRGMEVVFCDNRPDPPEAFDAAVLTIADRAAEQFAMGAP